MAVVWASSSSSAPPSCSNSLVPSSRTPLFLKPSSFPPPLRAPIAASVSNARRQKKSPHAFPLISAGCSRSPSSTAPYPHPSSSLPSLFVVFVCLKPYFHVMGYIAADIWNNTCYPKAADHVNTDKTWYVVDATDKVLGRLASTIAIYIRGKDLPTYTPSVDMGSFVIVVNAEKVAVSGKKQTQKLYRRHSGRPGGMTVETFDQLQKRIPERIIKHAVRGMLPKGRLGRALFNHLKVYKGPDHPHEAQKPIDLPIRDKRIQIQG